MARPIILSNGQLHVGINDYGLVHDFYFPYVGSENHSAGKHLRHRIGVWIDGDISWLDDGTWEFNFHAPHYALIGHIIAKNARLGVCIEFDDIVDAQMNAFMRNIHVTNLRDEDREIRLFLHQAFVIGDRRSLIDTVQYLPDSDAILHYRGRRAFVVGARHGDDPFDQYTTGLFGIEGHEGTYRDADDGELSMCAVEHGRVDSTIRFKLNIKARGTEEVHYWITAGRSTRQAVTIHKELEKSGVIPRFEVATKWWREWLKPAEKIAERLPNEYHYDFLRSVMVLKAHIDVRGAVIASTDTAMLHYERDAYGYCWPRDASYVLWPLIRIGYREEAENFFTFCLRVMHPSGYFLHKYSADGAVGSSWHPYIHDDGEIAPPIQLDETAIVIFLFAQYQEMYPDEHYLTSFYAPMIAKMADFMANYIDRTTGLPRASYDLWEEHFMMTTYTTSVVYAALLAAAELADVMKDEEHAVRWRGAAESIYEAAHKHLFNEERQAFYKGVYIENGEVKGDPTLDLASVFGAFMFGLFPIGSDELKASVATFERVFTEDGSIGLPRYENDGYLRAPSARFGNHWIVTTLWLAQYYNEIGDTEKTKRILDWAQTHKLQGGIFSEQTDPATGGAISVAPLAWSHAEFIATLLDTIAVEPGGPHD